MTAPRIAAIAMPKWGMTMTEGTLVDWLVPEGATVAPGQEIMEIETTKITNVVEATAGGVLRRRVAEPGKVLPVGALLGVLAGADVPEEEIDRFVAAHAVVDPDAGDAEAAPTPRLLDAAGGSLNALSLGGGEGLPVVLVHGFGGDLGAWLFNWDALGAERPVHALDLPGHGASPPRAGVRTPDDLAGAVREATDALGIERAHLVGHSLGGAVALALAQASPGRVASLALLAPIGLGPDADGGYLEAFMAAERRKPMKEALARLFADPGAVSSDMVEAMLRYKRLDGVPEALRAIASGFVDGDRQIVDLAGALAAFEGPVLVVWGEDDRIVPAAHAEGLSASARVETLPGLGHMPMMEDAAAVNRLLAEHLRAADRGSAR